MRAIAQTAAATETPGIAGKFQAVLVVNDARLLSQAHAFLERAKPFVATFVAHELPPNFLSSLRAGVEALERAILERVSGKAERVGARGGIESTMADGVRAVRRLCAIVPNKLQDPSAVRQWDAARRIDRGRVKTVEAAASNTPSPSTEQSDTAKPAA